MDKNSIKIESNVVVPVYGRWTALSREMKVGDSVLLDEKDAVCVRQALKMNGFGAAQRREGDQIRIWKIHKRVIK